MRYTLGVTVGTLLLSLVSCPAQGQIVEESVTLPFPADESPPFNLWMDVKLKKSQDIFAALTKADFARILDDTKQLKTLNELEGFVRKNVPDYRTYLKSFQFAVEEIDRQAKKQNIEGVTLGFQQLTMSCVNCHNHLRANPVDTAQE